MDLKDRDTKIKFYSGMRTIGGTFIEVSHNNSRIFFDCGAIFDPNIDDSKIEFSEIIEKELAPNIDNFYDRNYREFSSDSNTAVFVSHAHLDHTKMLNYVDESIPVYTSNHTKELINLLNINGDFLYKNKYLSKTTRDIFGVDYGDVVSVGEIKVEFVRVDHDAYGSCGFIITTPDMKIAYTGDIRLHGISSDNSINFIEKASNSDLLIIEGVSVSFEDSGNRIFEKDVINEFSQIANNHESVFFNYYSANVERLLNIIKTNNKKVVLDAYNANILKKTDNIDVLYYNVSNLKYDLDKNMEVDFDEVIKLKDKYIIQISKDNIYKKIDSFPENSVYIHFDSEPLGEFDPEYERFFKMFEKFNIKYYILHCSGHAYPEDLNKVIEGVKPKILVPIHSFKPEMLYNMYGERLLPEKNQSI